MLYDIMFDIMHEYHTGYHTRMSHDSAHEIIYNHDIISYNAEGSTRPGSCAAALGAPRGSGWA